MKRRLDQDDQGTNMTTDTVSVSQDRRRALVTAVLDAEAPLLESAYVDRAKLDAFCAVMAGNYHDNPYHNWAHGVDVFLNAHRLYAACSVQFEPMEALALLVGALAHDVDHPGVSNALLAERETEMSVLYNDQSALEMRSASLVFQTMRDPSLDFIAAAPREARRTFRRALIELVLATDIASPDRKLVVNHKWTQAVAEFDGASYAHREALLCLIVRAADVAAAVKSYDLFFAWALRLYHEMYRDPDARVSAAAFTVQQRNFLTKYCRPLFGALQPFLSGFDDMLPTLEGIIERWMALTEEERTAMWTDPEGEGGEGEAAAAGADAQ